MKSNRNKKPDGCTHPNCFICPHEDCIYNGGSENIVQYIGVDTRKKKGTTTLAANNGDNIN